MKFFRVYKKRLGSEKVMKSRKNILILFLFLLIISTNISIVKADAPLIAVMPFEEGDLSWKGFAVLKS